MEDEKGFKRLLYAYMGCIGAYVGVLILGILALIAVLVALAHHLW